MHCTVRTWVPRQATHKHPILKQIEYDRDVRGRYGKGGQTYDRWVNLGMLGLPLVSPGKGGMGTPRIKPISTAPKSNKTC